MPRKATGTSRAIASKARTRSTRTTGWALPERAESIRSSGSAFKPFPAATVRTLPAKEIFDAVLAGAGATLPRRDTVDLRAVSDAKTGKTAYRNGVVNSQDQVGGWPELKSAAAQADTDHDGIPDRWESEHGLNPNDPSDGNKDLSGDGYTNLEKYLNSLVPRKKYRPQRSRCIKGR